MRWQLFWHIENKIQVCYYENNSFFVVGENDSIQKKREGARMKNMDELILPPIYERNGRECYLDFIRQKLIYITPEETVRQKVISYLLNELEVPQEVISVEEHLSHYGINTKKRADVVIHKVDSEGCFHPVAIIECKAPNVYLDEKAERQIFEYCDLIEADYAMLTNGIVQRCFKYDKENDGYLLIENLPIYTDILCDKYNEFDVGEYPPRISFSEINNFLEETFKSYDDDWCGDISRLTPMNLAAPTFNLLEGLLDVRIKMPVGDYGLFKLIEDYGVRMLTYGNSSGGKFFGPYRSFLVDVNGSTEFYSIAISTYWKSSNPEKVKTCLSVAHDNEKDTHHALQLVVDDNLIATGNRIDFYHHGRITIGNKGSGKIAELRTFVNEKYPKIIRGTKFYLGSLVNDRLWRLDDPEVIELIVNLISYAMIRDEYREYVKLKK